MYICLLPQYATCYTHCSLPILNTLIVGKSTSNEAPHCVVFSILLHLTLWVDCFSEHLSFYVPSIFVINVRCTPWVTHLHKMTAKKQSIVCIYKIKSRIRCMCVCVCTCACMLVLVHTCVCTYISFFFKGTRSFYRSAMIVFLFFLLLWLPHHHAVGLIPFSSYNDSSSIHTLVLCLT